MGYGGVIGPSNQPSTSGDAGIWQNWNPSSTSFTQVSLAGGTGHASGVWDVNTMAQKIGNDKWPIPVDALEHIATLSTGNSSTQTHVSIENIPQEFAHLYMIIDCAGEKPTTHTSSTFAFHPLGMNIYQSDFINAGNIWNGYCQMNYSYRAESSTTITTDRNAVFAYDQPNIPIGIIAPSDWNSTLSYPECMNTASGENLTSSIELVFTNYSNLDGSYAPQGFFFAGAGVSAYNAWSGSTRPAFATDGVGTTIGQNGGIGALDFFTYNNGNMANGYLSLRCSIFGVK